VCVRESVCVSLVCVCVFEKECARGVCFIKRERESVFMCVCVYV